MAAAGGREAGRARAQAPSATRVAAASRGTKGCKGYYSFSEGSPEGKKEKKS